MNYPGGKNGGGLVQWLLANMPEHNVYCEPFAGSAALYRAKPPVYLSHLIDRDSAAPIFGPTFFAGQWKGSWHASQGCGIDWLEHNAASAHRDWFIYCDPPYEPARRVKRTVYAHELTGAEHARLLSILRELDCHVAISGYYTRRYQHALAGWNVATKTARTRGGPRVEYLWTNFQLAPRYRPVAADQLRAAVAVPSLAAGPGHRARLSARRKAQRWLSMLAAMPAWERDYMLEVLRRNPPELTK